MSKLIVYYSVFAKNVDNCGRDVLHTDFNETYEYSIQMYLTAT